VFSYLAFFSRGSPSTINEQEDILALKDLIATLAEALVDDPDAVEVEEVEDERGILVELRVAEDDIGKVIGKDGRTAQCLRVLLNAAAAKQGTRAQLEILD
jgi:uncharacterized protein